MGETGFSSDPAKPIRLVSICLISAIGAEIMRACKEIGGQSATEQREARRLYGRKLQTDVPALLCESTVVKELQKVKSLLPSSETFAFNIFRNCSGCQGLEQVISTLGHFVFPCPLIETLISLVLEQRSMTDSMVPLPGLETFIRACGFLQNRSWR